MSIPFDYDDPSLLDDFEALMDDFRFDSDWPSTPSVEVPNLVNDESSSTSTAENESPIAKKVKKKPRKSSSAKNVSKVTGAEMVVTKKSSSSSEAPRLKWFVFPSFDRSDSTIYFASSFARLCNSGDEKGLGKLIMNHCSKDTVVVLREGSAEVGGFRVPLAMYIDMLHCSNLINPDGVYCMHSTSVEGRKIHAVLYGKVTDSAEMYEHRASIVGPTYAPFFVGRRKDLLIRSMGLNSVEESKRNPILRLLDLNVEFQIYSKIDITLTLHERTKKVVDFSYLVKVTSVCYEGVHYPTV